jgi:hypothetical protein
VVVEVHHPLERSPGGLADHTEVMAIDCSNTLKIVFFSLT